MEVIKRKVLLENSIDRTANSPTYGTITATSFYINVIIVQNMDDMGLFTDFIYIPNDGSVENKPDYSILVDKLNLSGITFPFMLGIIPPPLTGITGTTEVILRLANNDVSNYYEFGNLRISGITDSKVNDVRSYNALYPYRAGFNTAMETYTAYNGNIIAGIDRVITIGDPIIYTFGALDDSNLGTPLQTTGLLYRDYTGLTHTFIIEGNSSVLPLTILDFIGEGWNETNTSLSALTKEEYLFGITSTPIIQSDVFIDRGSTSVMDLHLRLSEVKTLNELVKYGNGFYNLTIQ